MRFFSFIFRNTFRNRRRTILTILSISMSLFLISTLRTLLQSLENPTLPPESAKRVITRHATGLAQVMPVAYRDRIRQTPGVDLAINSQWFGGIYQDPANFFANFAVDADQFFDVYPDVHPQSEEQKQAFMKERTGAIVGESLAQRFGWKVGDRVTLQGSIFPVNVENVIVGLVSGGGSENVYYFHWDYFNELFDEFNQVGTFVVKARNAEDVAGISETVDQMFSNTAAPTKTETESAFVLGFMSMWGNVRLLIISISTVVLFTVILVAANTMAMSIRERTGEIAILRTLGFAPSQILGMMVTESALIALAGGLLGSLGARYFYASIDLNALTLGFVPSFDVRWGTVGLAAVISLTVAFFSTFVPAYNASRLPIAIALRRRGE